MQDVKKTDNPAYDSNQPFVRMMLEFIRLNGAEGLSDLIDIPASEQEEPLRNVA